MTINSHSLENPLLSFTLILKSTFRKLVFGKRKLRAILGQQGVDCYFKR